MLVFKNFLPASSPRPRRTVPAKQQTISNILAFESTEPLPLQSMRASK
jgi:hypothetical protein